MNEPALARLNHLMRIREEVETLSEHGPWTPPADWVDNGTHLTLVMDVPGVDADSLSVQDDNGETVTVRGERAPLDLDGEAVQVERPGGVFTRDLTPPSEVVPGTGAASLRAGVLMITFEKRHKTIDQR
ncbi:Hsp20/alpha crystallin family protein [Deinococcus maricopensis]|uniref:Heat shock protein Hsp20 n=1 Tax=Deinococcus maricopensis (strain DSM 21211 / LMG 22137 / NRRL B-23946 / LB-34) TaxID=709986 RepID=E8U8Z6_DEIML|nr:Hsp20/alpha crystallin family protein [Deinococcus maricopensis]ADV67535.1 heat shock protein Hsp20 [Deinococcus maricopensis DSM 21211]